MGKSNEAACLGQQRKGFQFDKHVETILTFLFRAAIVRLRKKCARVAYARRSLFRHFTSFHSGFVKTSFCRFFMARGGAL